MSNQRSVAEYRAMQVSLAYERQIRHAEVTDVSSGDARANAIVERALVAVSDLSRPSRLSVDIVSSTGSEIRIIEVKGRGSSGPVALLERQLDTLRRAGQHGWLYVVWNTTQPHPYQLWLVQNPSCLDWTEERAATRLPGTFRGTRHEALYKIGPAEIEAAGVRVDLSKLIGLPEKNNS